MNKPIVAVLLAIFIGGCGKGGDSDEVVVIPKGANASVAQGSTSFIPGLQETQKICSQCHALPSPTQHHPAAWPGIVARMENHMVANRRPMPSPQEREAILSYLQGGWQK